MKIPRESRQQAKRLYRACLKPDGILDERAVRIVVDRVSAAKPRNYLALLQYFYFLLEAASNARAVRVETATPLTDNGREIVDLLEQRFGPTTDYSYKHRPELIGGTRVCRGSVIWDNSILGRLERLRESFS